MKKIVGVFLCLCLSVAVPAADFGDKAVRVVRVYDGDTLIVSIPDWPTIVGQSISVRVYGIDTPEIRGQCDNEKEAAQQAKAFVQRFTAGKTVLLRHLRRDKYFRILADVEANGESLSEALIREGLAYPYFGETKINRWCAHGE